MFCPNCGNELPDGNRFCGNCGSVVETNITPLGNGTITTKKKRNFLNPVVCLAVIVVILIAVLVRCSHASAEPAIYIESISFNSSTCDISYKIENISDKDIAYIKFETYFYDQMGSPLKTDLSDDDFLNLNYTGPLYEGEHDEVYWQYLFEVPSNAAVVYPKNIIVTFTDDKEITFENDFYWTSDGFYGGELKD